MVNQIGGEESPNADYSLDRRASEGLARELVHSSRPNIAWGQDNACELPRDRCIFTCEVRFSVSPALREVLDFSEEYTSAPSLEWLQSRTCPN